MDAGGVSKYMFLCVCNLHCMQINMVHVLPLNQRVNMVYNYTTPGETISRKGKQLSISFKSQLPDLNHTA